jgi:hypothetical protein
MTVAQEADGEDGFPPDPEPFQRHIKDKKVYVWDPDLGKWIEDTRPPTPKSSGTPIVVKRLPPDVEAGL